MANTEPVEWVNQPGVGYMLNAEFSDTNRKDLMQLISQIKMAFNDAVFCIPETSLHITLLDWIAPLVNYDGQNKDELFTKLQPSYDKALEESVVAWGPISVRFNELHVSPSTIFIVGYDDGQFQAIRSSFLDKVELFPGTKLPPRIPG